MSYISHLRQPPTQTRSGATAPLENGAVALVANTNGENAAAVTTTSINEPYGPRQWNSNLIQLSGKNRALNEFSVERLGEKTEQNLVMLHGKISSIPCRDQLIIWFR